MRAITAIAMLMLFAVAGCGGGSSEATPAVTITTESAGREAPDVEGITLEGDRLSLAELRGRAVFVNVWASW